MILLSIRSNEPVVEISLLDGTTQLAVDAWEGKRELARVIHHRIEDLLKSQGKQLSDVEGIVALRGPGSFTSLRIGLTVVNTLAYSFNIPIVGTLGDNWLAQGIARLQRGENDKIAIPEYGRGAHITVQTH
ncbi:MAG TPA: tRNA (adenosine(37)-N6)-threonylcarbamoyltransferase complex dimerization subunit type 1 TsaB [Bacillota bacterium]|nr:tRNA (adenosine(37)-N6)-threonylcarbamoyltransferase complex dimerization subunit type 1 TsaB [Bacillota bacterium]